MIQRVYYYTNRILLHSIEGYGLANELIFNKPAVMSLTTINDKEGKSNNLFQ